MTVTAVFRKPASILISTLVFCLIFGIGIWLPIRNALPFFLSIQDTFLGALLFLIRSLPELIILNVPKVTLLLLALTALLASINASLVLHYFRERARRYRESGLGLMGMISGVVGVCCTSCGSIVISSLLGVSAAGTVLGVLPFKGLEFSMLAIVVLTASIYHVGRKITVPMGCQINQR